MNEIERAAEAFSKARSTLTEQVAALTAEIDAAKRARMRAIRAAVARAAEKRDELEQLVTDGRELFAKPKTRTLHGIQVGYKKQPGGLEIPDEAATLARIKKMFADDDAALQLLVRTKETPVKDALADLSGDQLKKLGVKVINDSDKVVIKAVDGEVDKVVDALLKGAGEEE